MSGVEFNAPIISTRRKIPSGRVELHCHIDGCIRLSTAWELSKAKQLPLPGKGTLQDLYDAVVLTEPANLTKFLEGFKYLIPPICGDTLALERIAYEMCEDKSRAGVLYFEGRYCPHLLSTVDVSPTMVVEAINRGLARGEKDFGIIARSILGLFIGNPEWCPEIVSLCEKYRDEGVVGIDICGDETKYGHGTDIKIPQPYVDAFLEARKLGIHRTMHAGEVGSHAVVDKAINVLHCERIGHGYHVLEDINLYKEAIAKKIHFEMCPHSSLLTGAVTQTTLKHPIVRLAEDCANFSINTDDTSIINKEMTDEYSLVETWGFTEVHKVRAAFNAAKSCFLPKDKKMDLIRQLMEVYGIPVGNNLNETLLAL